MTTCFTCAPRITPAPSRGVITVRWGSGEQNNTSGVRTSGSKVTGGACGHQSWLAWAPIYTVFTKKLSKNGQKEGTPCFGPPKNLRHPPRGPPGSRAPRSRFCCPISAIPGAAKATSGRVLEYTRALVFGEGGQGGWSVIFKVGGLSF